MNSINYGVRCVFFSAAALIDPNIRAAQPKQTVRYEDSHPHTVNVLLLLGPYGVLPQL